MQAERARHSRLRALRAASTQSCCPRTNTHVIVTCDPRPLVPRLVRTAAAAAAAAVRSHLGLRRPASATPSCFRNGRTAPHRSQQSASSHSQQIRIYIHKSSRPAVRVHTAARAAPCHRGRTIGTLLLQAQPAPMSWPLVQTAHCQNALKNK